MSVYSRLSGLISAHWRAGLGGLSALALVGILDGVFYYSTFDVPFIEYAEWGDYARVGVFGGLIASVVTVLLGVALMVALGSVVASVAGLLTTLAGGVDQLGRWIGALTLALSEIFGIASKHIPRLRALRATRCLSTAWRGLLRANAARAAEWIRLHFGWALLAVYFGCAFAYVVLHSQQGQHAIRMAVGAADSTDLSAYRWLRPLDLIGLGDEARAVAGWVLGLRSPDLDQPKMVRGSNGDLLSAGPLSFVGKLGGHYVFLHMTELADSSVGGSASRDGGDSVAGRVAEAARKPDSNGPAAPGADRAPVLVVLANGLRSIEVYSHDVVVRSASADQLSQVSTKLQEHETRLNELSKVERVVNVQVASTYEAPLEENNLSFGFAVYFEEDGEAGLSEHSEAFLDHVGQAIVECMQLSNAAEVTLEIRGEVSSGGIPDASRYTVTSQIRQDRLARMRSAAIADYLAQIVERRIIVEVGGAESEGPFVDRVRDESGEDRYKSALGLLNRRGWVTVHVKPGTCPLRPEHLARVP